MKKILFFSIAASISVLPSLVYAQIPGDLEFERLQQNQQQQQITELSEVELNGLLSTACENSSNRNRNVVARKIKKEVSTSLSAEKLEELTRTAIEIKDLPNQEKQVLCEK